MDLIVVLLVFGAFFCAVAGFAFSWFMIPWNSASIKRLISRKNYVVIGVRKAGGQIVFHVKKHETPVIQIGDRAYTPMEKRVNFFGSVPCYLFNQEDIKPLNLVPSEEVRDTARDSEHIAAVILLIKALYEALAMKKMELIMLLLGACCLGALLNLGGIYITYQEVINTGEACRAAATTVLPNMLGG